jgi:hypothetical protein
VEGADTKAPQASPRERGSQSDEGGLIGPESLGLAPPPPPIYSCQAHKGFCIRERKFNGTVVQFYDGGPFLLNLLSLMQKPFSSLPCLPLSLSPLEKLWQFVV